MGKDGGAAPSAIRVDGGMAVNDWVMQFLADQLAIPVERPRVTETTALGAAYLAGWGAGGYASTAEIARRWTCERRFRPSGRAGGRGSERERLYQGWREAVQRVRGTGA